MTVSPKITVLLADDHPLALMGIRDLLAQAADLEIIGEAGDGFQVKELVATLRPNVLLLDLKMPGPRPAEIEKWVRENFPETVTLVLTAHDRDRYLAGMLEAGAAGYMDKNITSETLIDAIRRAVQGEILFDQQQLQRVLHWKESIESKINQLTPKEKEILTLLGKGSDNKRIASLLDISEKTVSFHLTNIFVKIEAKSRLEAAIWAKDHLSDDLEEFPG